MIFDMTKRKSGGGETVYIADSGMLYLREMEIPTMPTNASIPLFKNATELVSFVCHRAAKIGGNGNLVHRYFQGCTNLERIEFPELSALGNGWCDYVFGNCPNLKIATFGSIGHPLTEFYNTSYANPPFFQDTQNDLVITIYVNASDLASVPTEVKRYAPWGATNATIVYRSSTTGEVLT